MKRHLLLTASICAFGASWLPAMNTFNFGTGPINFEGVGLTDNQGIEGDYFVTNGTVVQFSFSVGNATIEDANLNEFRAALGSSNETSDGSPFGFANDDPAVPGNSPVGVAVDRERTGYAGNTTFQPGVNTGPGLGNFFLRNDPTLGDVNLTINYTNGTSSQALSFQLWDIDGTTGGSEGYLIQFRDAFSNLLGTVTTPVIANNDPGTSLDALPYLVAFTSSGNAITQVSITFNGTKPVGSRGVAFDNFDATRVIPEPGTASLFLAAGLAVGVLPRRRSRRG